MQGQLLFVARGRPPRAVLRLNIMKKNKKNQKNLWKTLDDNPEMCYNKGTKEMEDLIMKYVVEVRYGDRNEWSDEIA